MIGIRNDDRNEWNYNKCEFDKRLIGTQAFFSWRLIWAFISTSLF